MGASTSCSTKGFLQACDWVECSHSVFCQIVATLYVIEEVQATQGRLSPGPGLDDEISCFVSRQVQELFLVLHTSRLVVGSSHTRIPTKRTSNLPATF